MNYNMALPKRQLIDWNGARGFRLGQYILMHSVIYRVEMLRNCGLELPKHTFYVDNILHISRFINKIHVLPGCEFFTAISSDATISRSMKSHDQPY